MRLSTTCLLALALASSVFSFSATAQTAPARPKPDAAKGEQLYAQGDEKRGLPACASCHGAAGNSAGAANPKIAGQHADYVYKQLANFKPKAQGQQPERPNPIMTPFATLLSEEEMRSVGLYLSQQAQKPAVAKNKESVALGQKIYRGGIAEKNVPACAGCHGPAGTGIPAQYPRIGGQFAEYTEAQLLGFRNNVRKNSAQMSAIAGRMSDAEIKAVSDYVAGLR
jgi:cytochrome c553